MQFTLAQVTDKLTRLLNWVDSYFWTGQPIQTASLSSGWTNQVTLQYQLMGDNTVQIDGELIVPSGAGSAGFIVATVGSNYAPNRNVHLSCIETSSTTPFGVVATRICNVDSSGNIKYYGPAPTAGNNMRIFGRYPLSNFT